MIDFIKKQISCCLFPALLFISMFVTKYVSFSFIHRYDLLLILSILIQIVLILIKYETWSEVKIILIFHIVGLILEIYKTHIGMWSYPEPGIVKILGVPLYSGFMYSSVGSYIYRAWKVFDLKYTDWPNKTAVISLCLAIYLNFFTHHYIWDLRYVIILATIVLFWKTEVYFTLTKKTHKMWMNFAFLCIGIALWVAENISTFFSAWKYPDQKIGWHLVNLGKISSWSLLIILSIVLVYYNIERRNKEI
ncbi:DUF817 domain-containing protein [Lactobacillus sp. YT155]|uniref:DUF817 domain-containing protein n=1 Tax=Lactobacillus sp. YT155 TaxID=3060955 RepID=UPI00265D8275|nr:DUF817 domain-containing protein [Lactobacillus sp. YT155]MDO1605667.1 DUF817 domain-containing protein [Lactobacillus sp. YT155]